MKNLKVYALAGVAAVAVVGGTFAYYQAQSTFTNAFSTTGYSTSTIERFNPDEATNWQPGQELDKEVYAVNTGNGDVWVRVKFEEQWTNAQDAMGVLDSRSAEFNAISPGEGRQESKTDGHTITEGKQDGSVVYKKFGENIITTDEKEPKKWFLGTDGWYYYTSKLTNTTGENTTPKLLDSVTLCGDVDMGKKAEVEAYILVDKDSPDVPVYDAATAQEKGWLLKKPTTIPAGKTLFSCFVDGVDSTAKGYSGASYALDIEVQIVQADANAAEGWLVKPGTVQQQ